MPKRPLLFLFFLLALFVIPSSLRLTTVHGRHSGLAFIFPHSALAQDDSPTVLVLTADGPLTPAMGEYLRRGIRTAAQQEMEAIIFRLDTPGGSLDLMDAMVQDIRASDIPIIVYVWPRGGIAGSAGTVITMAGHVAVMAPETAIGAASPVGSSGEDLGETIEAKLKEATRAQIRSLMEGRRPPEAIALAEDTIENATAVTAAEALEIGMIDFIAPDLTTLLEQADGMTVSTHAGERTLNTANALTSELTISFIEQLLATLTNPNIVFILLTLGVQAILIEISSPGGWVAGFIGVVCLSLAAYGLGVLQVNWLGLIFLLTSFVLFVLDIKAPTHGALTAAGVASFIVGALVLFNSPGTPQVQRVSVPLVVASGLVVGGSFFGILMFALRSQKAPVRTGQESVTGRVGTARSEINPTGIVQLTGEQWTAELAKGEEPIPSGTRVQVVSVEGVRVIVKRA
ncbi:MAG TPA: nodulation protein NfeD [Anaerolineales bacterium]|nr:nodulation protein NfeD [Anaerolineales bacterium]